MKRPAGRLRAATLPTWDLAISKPTRSAGAETADEQAVIPGNAADGELLDQVERRGRVFEGYLRTEVQGAIKQARGMMATDAENAGSKLKLVLEKVQQSSELNSDVRSQLGDQVRAALQAAGRQGLVQAERDLRRQQVAAEVEARERINRDMFVREQKVEQLMARFSSLMDEERYRDAEAVADIAEEMEPGRAGLRTAELDARMVGYTTDMAHLRDTRHKGLRRCVVRDRNVDVPISDEPPILYPDPEVWQMLTERRKKYKAVDLAKDSPAEAKIAAALTEKTELDFTDQPLSDVIEYLKAKHEIEIQLDSKALADAGVGSDTPVTRNIKGITLRSALRLLLGELDLTYVIRDEVLMITTKTEAENILSTRVYPVADLVIPVRMPNDGRRRNGRRNGRWRYDGRRHGRHGRRYDGRRNGRNGGWYDGRWRRFLEGDHPRKSSSQFHSPLNTIDRMAWLQSINGPNSGRKFAIPKGRTVLGRELNCDLVLDGDAVSRRHAQIEWVDDDYFIEDLKSRNRTFVNGQEVVGRRKLCDNDQVKVCDFSSASIVSPVPPRCWSMTRRKRAARRSCRSSTSSRATAACAPPRSTPRSSSRLFWRFLATSARPWSRAKYCRRSSTACSRSLCRPTAGL